MTAPISHPKPGEEHTTLPWTSKVYKSQVVLYGPGEIQVLATSWHGSIRSSYPLKAESLANAAFVLEAVNSHASLKARNEELEEHARFLLDRLEEFDPGDDEPEREFHGHVTPAIARLRAALQSKGAA